MLTVSDLRNSFIDYFMSRGHKHVHSSSLIPHDDPTLLFTTAGMVQFKPMFAGVVVPDYECATTVQKCLRTSDLENVGRTLRHCTFFEMLGNFSFGNYFKKEAIAMAWEYSVDVLQFNPEKIWVSIYIDDDEAFRIWNSEVGVPAGRIVRLGREDNFWGPAGDTGACGPCSELYIDKGEEFGCGDPECKPGCDCERFMEYWNLVFNQFDMQADGTMEPLPKTGIDTGMGLERLATICQNVSSIYETDELKHLVDYVCRNAGVTYEGDAVVPVNVVVEHSRALTFAMADGVYPSNEGRGYVLRRILRRALRFARNIGIREPFLYTMVDPIVEIMGEYYPEIVTAAENVKKVLQGEERRFLDTLENGMVKIGQIMDAAKQDGRSELSGGDAFVLYDTYGFPVEMTTEMAAERGLAVNMDEFRTEMEKQRSRGKESWKSDGTGTERVLESLAAMCKETEFTGYTEYQAVSTVRAVSLENGESVRLQEGMDGFIVLDRTPFYGESGGQIGDSGEIFTDTLHATVLDTKKINKTVIHHVHVNRGACGVDDTVTASIDVLRRNLTRANHTVTHLLQASLRQVLGSHVKQSGSLVGPERMRFDFTHFEAMSDGQIREVEELVNRKIWENLEVTTRIMPIDEALKSGAMAEFGEKYDDNVRVISAGGFSTELCGGTHVNRTGEIGLFKIVKESSPGAGTRRIDGITLKGVRDRLDGLLHTVNRACSLVNATEGQLVDRIAQILEQNDTLKSQLQAQKSDMLASRVDEIISGRQMVGPVSFIPYYEDGVAVDDLRELSDRIRNREQNSVVLLASSHDGKVTLICAATKPAVQAGVHAGNIIREIAPLVGGKGGGRPDMAQAGGKDTSGISDAMERGAALVNEQVG